MIGKEEVGGAEREGEEQREIKGEGGEREKLMAWRNSKLYGIR